MEDLNQDTEQALSNDGFQEAGKTNKPVERSSKNLAMMGICANNRPRMEFWNYKVVVQPSAIKDGNIRGWIRNRLKALYIQAKKVDPKFVWYKYEPEYGEPNAILEAAKFPETFEILEGEGSANRYANCYVYGLRIFNPSSDTMNIHTEIRVGFEAQDLAKRLKEWVMTQIPQPYLREKDLQAPHTKELGFLLGANPFMRDQPAFKVLNKIVNSMRLTNQDKPVYFAVSNRWINDGNFTRQERTKKPSPIQQNRGLHIEGLRDDASRTKAYLKQALKSPTWKKYTNSPVSITPSWRESEDKMRAKYGVETHRKAMADLSWAVTDQITNPDHLNLYVTDATTRKPVTLREILLAMSLEVELTGVNGDGEVYTKRIQDKLFFSIDPMFSNKGKWVFVFPKAYAETARNRVTGLYTYIKHMLMEERMTTAEEVEPDIKCWFTQDAIEASRQMEFRDGKVITAEALHQEEAIALLENLPWFVKDSSNSPARAGKAVPTINKTPRKYDHGDTASLHTQGTTATNKISQELARAQAKAEQMKAQANQADPSESSEGASHAPHTNNGPS